MPFDDTHMMNLQRLAQELERYAAAEASHNWLRISWRLEGIMADLDPDWGPKAAHFLYLVRRTLNDYAHAGGVGRGELRQEVEDWCRALIARFTAWLKADGEFPFSTASYRQLERLTG